MLLSSLSPHMHFSSDTGGKLSPPPARGGGGGYKTQIWQRVRTQDTHFQAAEKVTISLKKHFPKKMWAQGKLQTVYFGLVLRHGKGHGYIYLHFNCIKIILLWNCILYSCITVFKRQKYPDALTDIFISRNNRQHYKRGKYTSVTLIRDIQQKCRRVNS